MSDLGQEEASRSAIESVEQGQKYSDQSHDLAPFRTRSWFGLRLEAAAIIDACCSLRQSKLDTSLVCDRPVDGITKARPMLDFLRP